MSVPLTLTQLFNLFPDNAAAEHWVCSGMLSRRRPAAPPASRVTFSPAPRAGPRPTAAGMAAGISPSRPIVMHGSNLGLRVWVTAIHLLMSRPKGISSRQLHRDLGISYKAAWHRTPSG